MTGTKELRRLALDGDLVAMQAIVIRLERAEKERDALSVDRATLQQMAYSLKDRLEVAEKERDALRAKIAEMERQEPYCWTTSPPSGHYSRFNPEVDRWIENGWTVVPLYLAPGAQPAPSLASGDVSLISEGKTQPAPSVPETWLERGLKELDAIRQNSNRDDWQPNDENVVRRLYQAMVADGLQQAPSVLEGWPTEEMTTAFARVFNVRDQCGTFPPAFRAALEATPEAKP